MPSMNSRTRNIIALCINAMFVGSSLLFGDEIMQLLRDSLEAGYVTTFLTFCILSVILTHSFMVKNEDSRSGYLFKGQFFLLDISLSCGTYIAVAITACSLLKGAIIQQFYGDIVYFTKFDKLDIWVLMGVSALLIWYILFNMYLLLADLTTNTAKVQKAEGRVNENQV